MPEPTWEEVERYLESELSQWPEEFPCHAKTIRALDAVRLVRALEEGTIRVTGWNEDRTQFGVFGDLPNGGEEEFVGPTPIAAATAALNASSRDASVGYDPPLTWRDGGGSKEDR